MAIKTAIWIPDCHVPYHDVKAYKLALRVSKFINPDYIYISGDYADMYAVNSHGKDPKLYHLLEEEIMQVNYALDELDTLFPKAEKHFIEGNHENRLARYIAKNCPALFGVTNTESLLNLDVRKNWEFHEYGGSQLVSIGGSKLCARHEPASASSAVASARKSMCDLVYGHIHRIEEAYVTRADGRSFVNFSCGWLGDHSQQDVFGYVKFRPNWQLGFGIIQIDTVSQDFHHNIVRILPNYTCSYGGKIYA